MELKHIYICDDNCENEGLLYLFIVTPTPTAGSQPYISPTSRGVPSVAGSRQRNSRYGGRAAARVLGSARLCSARLGTLTRMPPGKHLGDLGLVLAL
jgi:hypothetical protein